MMRKNLLLLICISAVFVFFYSCNSTGYDIEDVEKADTVTTHHRTEVKKETEALKPEIKEEPVEILPKITRKFTIQIGAFQSESRAIETMNKAHSLISYEIYYNLFNGLYKVRFGEFDTLPEALQVLESIRNSGFGDSFVVEIKKNN